MKRIALLAALLLAACAPKTDLKTGPMSVRMVRSEIKRAPEATYLDGQGGNYKWNYTTGLELRSFLAVSRTYDIPEFDAYVRAWYDGVLDEGGEIGGKYDLNKFNLDHICPARTLIGLYQATPDVRYAMAIEMAREQLKKQPRTEAGAPTRTPSSTTSSPSSRWRPRRPTTRRPACTATPGTSPGRCSGPIR